MTAPIKLPVAPAKVTQSKENLPVETKKPEKGIMISEGMGMQADSKTIKPAMPM